jgi:branched-chain amino acid transport system substrate-binding protein
VVRAAGAAAIAAAMLVPPALAQNIKIGVVTTYSGPLASPGVEMDKGLSLYFDLHKKDLPPGVTVELIRRDDTNNPDTGKRVAQELITRDQVQFLCGAVYSPIAGAIAPLAGEAKVPFVIMNAAGSSITRISPFVVRDSFTLWQVSSPMGQWAAKNGIKEAYTAVSDYAPGIRRRRAASRRASRITAARSSARCASRSAIPISCPSCNASRTPSPRRCSSSCRRVRNRRR